MEALTKKDIKDLRDYIVNQFVKSSRTRRTELFTQGNINRNDFNEIGDKEQNLLAIAEDLNGKVTIELLTDLEEPYKQINTAINNIEKTIKKIEEYNHLFAQVAVAIDIVATLVSAVGNPNPAKISVILNKLIDKAQ